MKKPLFHAAIGILALAAGSRPLRAEDTDAIDVREGETTSTIENRLLFFHGSDPEDERTMFDNFASLGIAWSDD